MNTNNDSSRIERKIQMDSHVHSRAIGFTASPCPTNLTSSWISSSPLDLHLHHHRVHTPFVPSPSYPQRSSSSSSPSSSSNTPTVILHTVQLARRSTTPHNAKNNRPPTKQSTSTPRPQASPFDHIISSLAPSIAPASSTSRPRTHRPPSSPTPIPAAPLSPRRRRKSTVGVATHESRSQSDSGNRNRKTADKKTTVSDRSHATVDIVPEIPAIPSVTEEETNFLNEQIEKRKAEKAAQQLKKESKAKAIKANKKVESRKEKIQESPSTTRKKALKRNRKPSASKTVTISAPIANFQDTFRAYMAEISQNDLLEQSEVTDLARHIREGMKIERDQHTLETKLGHRPSILELAKHLNKPLEEIERVRMCGTAAKNELVSANLRLVTSVANKIMKSKQSNSMLGLTLDDMVQEGSVGLIRAAEKFDVSKGYKFSTYATWWVRAYVMRSITNQGRCIKVPSSIVDEYVKIKKKYTELKEKYFASSSDHINFQKLDDEVARELGITTGKLRMVMNVVTQVPTSLDLPIGGSDSSGSSSSYSSSASSGRSLGEVVKGDDEVEQKMVEQMEKRELDDAMKKYLRPIERAVVRLRFGLEDGQPRSFRETGELLGLSKERIRQIVFRALPKLKTPEIQRMLHQATTR